MLSKIREDAVIVPKTIGYKLNNGLATLSDEEEACAKPEWTYLFARDVPGADIEKCQEKACTDSEYAYWFAKNVPGADIGKCQEAACKDPKWAYWFARGVTGADVEKCRQICKGTKYAF
jgi:hypothetical protein